MDGQNSKRVRINAVQDSKGFFKLDVTAEVERVDETNVDEFAAELLVNAILQARKNIEESGMKWLPDPLEDKK